MRNLVKHILFLLIVVFSITVSGQTVLLKQTVPEDFSEVDDNFGPNRGHFSYPYFGIGFHSEGYSHENDTLISPDYGRSFELKFGTRMRFRINKFLAFGSDLGVGYSSFRIDLKDEYALANFSPNVTKAKYQLFNTGLASYFQVNFKPKRGNQLGTYLDFGLYGDYNFGRRFTQTISINDKESSKYILKNLQDFEKLKYGAIVRFGKNVWAVYAKYRYSSSFKNKESIGNYELPRLTFGFEYFIGTI